MQWRTGIAALAPEAQVAWIEREADELEQANALALDFILGGGLDAEGKAKWINTRRDEGMGPLQIMRDALSYTEGQIAT